MQPLRNREEVRPTAEDIDSSKTRDPEQDKDEENPIRTPTTENPCLTPKKNLSPIVNEGAFSGEKTGSDHQQQTGPGTYQFTAADAICSNQRVLP